MLAVESLQPNVALLLPHSSVTQQLISPEESFVRETSAAADQLLTECCHWPGFQARLTTKFSEAAGLSNALITWKGDVGQQTHGLQNSIFSTPPFSFPSETPSISSQESCRFRTDHKPVAFAGVALLKIRFHQVGIGCNRPMLTYILHVGQLRPAKRQQMQAKRQ